MREHQRVGRLDLPERSRSSWSPCAKSSHIGTLRFHPLSIRRPVHIDLCIQQAPSHFRHPPLERAWLSLGRSRRGSTTVERSGSLTRRANQFPIDSPALRSTKCDPLVRSSVKAPAVQPKHPNKARADLFARFRTFGEHLPSAMTFKRRATARIDNAPPDRGQYGSPTR